MVKLFIRMLFQIINVTIPIQLSSVESDGDDDLDDVLAESAAISVSSYYDPEVTNKQPLRSVRRRHAGRSDTSSCATGSVCSSAGVRA